MSQELTYKQVPQDQIDLWLNDPVTKVYFEALGLLLDDVREEVANSAIGS